MNNLFMKFIQINPYFIKYKILNKTWISISNKLNNKIRSRSLSELTRQFTPPTKNDHAPPPNKS